MTGLFPHRPLLLATILCVGLVFVGPTSSAAQTLQDELSQHILQLQKGGSTTEAGSKPLAPGVRSRIERQVNDHAASIDEHPAIKEIRENLPEDPSEKILDHVKIPGGIPLPTKEQVIGLTAGIALVPPKKGDAPVIPQAPSITLRPCEKSGVTRIKSPEDPSNSANRGLAGNQKISKTTVYRDVLYVPEALMPNDPQEIFGPTPSVRVVKSPVQSELTGRIDFDEVTCLPYRRRMVGDYDFRYTGLDALKNFESSNNSVTGKTHTWAAEAYNAYK